MKTIKLIFLTIILGILAYACQQTPEPKQEIQKPKYAADVPEFLLTPDKVETDFLGDLEFFDGMPSESTVQKTYDFLDLSRGVEAFLNGMPATSIYAFLEVLKQGGLEPGDLGITDDLLDARMKKILKDAKGQYLDGGETYKVTLPAPIPVNYSVTSSPLR